MCPWKRDVDGLVPFWVVNPLPALRPCRTDQYESPNCDSTSVCVMKDILSEVSGRHHKSLHRLGQTDLRRRDAHNQLTTQTPNRNLNNRTELSIQPHQSLSCQTNQDKLRKLTLRIHILFGGGGCQDWWYTLGFCPFPSFLPYHKHNSPGTGATNQVCQSGRYSPPRSPDCIIFCGAHTPSLAHISRADSITTGAETAAAGWVMPSLNRSSALGFWAQKATRTVKKNH